MKAIDGGPIITGGKNTVRQTWSNNMEKLRWESFLLVSDTRAGGDHIMGRVVRFEISGDILGTNYGKVILDSEHFRFLV